MKSEKISQVQVEIEAVANKNGISNWAFCGEEKNRTFVGFMGMCRTTQGKAMLTVLNVGRLWQYARQSCRALLDSYERLP
jgi:hypothetical protein